MVFNVEWIDGDGRREVCCGVVRGGGGWRKRAEVAFNLHKRLSNVIIEQKSAFKCFVG